MPSGRGITEKLIDPTRATPIERSMEDALAWSEEERAEACTHAVAFGADHFGAEVARFAAEYLDTHGVPVLDYATPVFKAAGGEKYNYSAGALPPLLALTQGLADRVIVICGNGVGMRNMGRAWPGTRVTYGEIVHEVRSGRKAEDANVLALGARLHGDLRDRANADLLRLFLKTFLTTRYEGLAERYQNQEDEIRRWAARAAEKGTAVVLNEFEDAIQKYPMLYGIVDLEAVLRARGQGGAAASPGIGRMSSIAGVMIDQKRKR